MHNINSEIFFFPYKNTFLPVDGFKEPTYPLPLPFHIRPFHPFPSLSSSVSLFIRAREYLANQ